MKGMVHHKFFTVFSQAGESFSQGLGQLSVNFVSWISNKNTKQKNYIYCWLFIMLLLKGFSYPMRKQRESEGTSEIRQISQRRAAVWPNTYCIQAANCGSAAPFFGFFSYPVWYVCLHSTKLLKTLFTFSPLLTWTAYKYSAYDELTNPCICL